MAALGLLMRCLELLAPALSKITICEMEKREKIERGFDQALMVVLKVVFLARLQWRHMPTHLAILPLPLLLVVVVLVLLVLILAHCWRQLSQILTVAEQ